MPQANSDTLSLRSIDGQIEIVFTWEHDRFGHVVRVGQQVVASSVEGNSDDDWPPSPPIQQLSSQSIQGRPVLLGVGSAGRAHWSISIETIDNDAIHIEMACRSKQQPQRLQSSYQQRRAGPWQVVPRCASLQGQDQLVIRPVTVQAGTTRWSYELRVKHP